MSKQKFPADFLKLLKSVKGKRPKTVIDHILKHGVVSILHPDYHSSSASTYFGAHSAPYGHEISKGYDKTEAWCAVRTMDS